MTRNVYNVVPILAAVILFGCIAMSSRGTELGCYNSSVGFSADHLNGVKVKKTKAACHEVRVVGFVFFKWVEFTS